MFSRFKKDKKSKDNEPEMEMPNITNNTSAGDFFIRMSFELLKNSKPSRGNVLLKDAITNALEALDQPSKCTDPLIVFKPFQIACESQSNELLMISIDCLGKLFTYNYWKFATNIKSETYKKDNADDSLVLDPDVCGEIISFVIDGICDSFRGEETDEDVQMQIIKV
jgi:brefeldin A-inhibited guanine nucleotide-exchange protein